MLKRIFYIAIYTGIGQLLSIFALKYISQHNAQEQLKTIASIDSLTFFIINIIALGLQPAAMRNLALTDDWKAEYQHTQTARITLGIFMMALAALAFWDPHYILFLAAPVFAWSGDYALYSRGFSVTGAAVAFVRLLIPFSLLILFAHFQSDHLALIYIISLTGTYAVTNLYISWFLKTPYLFRPHFKSLQLYVSSLALGLVTLSLYFIGLGVILVVPYFYGGGIVAAAFVGLKFYTLFKGVLRIILQAFVKEMVKYEVSLKIDQLSTLIGIAFSAFLICFPHTFIKLFFGETYLPDKSYFMVLSLAGLVYSQFSSLTTKALLEKKDRPYAFTASFAAILTILLTIIASFVWQSALAIGLSLLIGEIVFAAGMLLLMKHGYILWDRLFFLFKNALLFLIPLSISYLFTDAMVPFLAAIVLFTVVTALLYFRKFGLPAKE